MQFLLRCAELLVDGFYLRHVLAARLVSLRAIVIIGKNCFRETKLDSGAFRVSIIYIYSAEDARELPLEDAIC